MDFPKTRQYLWGALCESNAQPAGSGPQDLTLLASQVELQEAEASLEEYPIKLCFDLGYYNLMPHPDQGYDFTRLFEITERYF